MSQTTSLSELYRSGKEALGQIGKPDPKTELEREKARLCEQLGSSVYREYQKNPESFEPFRSVLHLIEDVDERIAQLQAAPVKASSAIGECPQCGASVNEGDLFCMGCGLKLQGVELKRSSVCPSCSESVGEGDVFCLHCGAKLGVAPSALDASEDDQAKDQLHVKEAEPKASSSPMPTCSRCGAAMKPGWSFCGECGAPSSKQSQGCVLADRS